MRCKTWQETKSGQSSHLEYLPDMRASQAAYISRKKRQKNFTRYLIKKTTMVAGDEREEKYHRLTTFTSQQTNKVLSI